MERIQNPPKECTPITWKEILAEEPFQGEHWRGAYGFPPGSIVETWETRNDSSDSLSTIEGLTRDNNDSFSLDEFDATSEALNKIERPQMSLADATRLREEKYAHRQIVDDLVSRQYWRPDWHIDAALHRPFHLGDASTLYLATQRLATNYSSFDIPDEVWEHTKT